MTFLERIANKEVSILFLGFVTLASASLTNNISALSSGGISFQL
jgi:hypothetical protein